MSGQPGLRLAPSTLLLALLWRTRGVLIPTQYGRAAQPTAADEKPAGEEQYATPASKDVLLGPDAVPKGGGEALQ